jgi:hypothetical protein
MAAAATDKEDNPGAILSSRVLHATVLILSDKYKTNPLIYFFIFIINCLTNTYQNNNKILGHNYHLFMA